MRFSTRTRYGLRLLCYLARQPEGQLVQLPEIAREEDISLNYLEHIMRLLHPSGLVRAVRGAAGGYTLACDPSTVTLEYVVGFLEGELCAVECLKHDGNCLRREVCSTRGFWEEMNEHIRSFLRVRTLNDLAADTADGEGCGV